MKKTVFVATGDYRYAPVMPKGIHYVPSTATPSYTVIPDPPAKRPEL